MFTSLLNLDNIFEYKIWTVPMLHPAVAALSHAHADGPKLHELPKSGVVLVDCDEVLLSWHTNFRTWALSQGIALTGEAPLSYNIGGWLGEAHRDLAIDLIRRFNGSAETGFGDLRPLPGVPEFLLKAREAGLRVRVITACSLDPTIMRIRTDNLTRAFGAGLIEDVAFVDLGASKAAELNRHPKGSWWFDDLPKHVEAGNEAGHTGFVVATSHNWAQRDEGTHDHLRWIDGLSDMIPSIEHARCDPFPCP
ncbi:hypothetical protein [Paracoccus sp. ME4]|uniref:hypothetical protein n=1 Tax=Paracoccus sp. ME4 TaxID=3138066 RepID=UPI00398B046A